MKYRDNDMIQASIYISVFLRYLLSNMFNFDNSIDVLKLLQSCVIFKQGNNHEVSFDENFWIEFFTTPNSKISL